MQHKLELMGSQRGSRGEVIKSVILTSKLIGEDFTATLINVRVNLLTLVLISWKRGAA